MKLKAYILVFNGLADWEPAHALCEIHKSRKYDVVAVGFTAQPVMTMAGLRVLPDTTIDKVNIEEAAIFILPGGDVWQRRSFKKLIKLLHQLHAAKVPIAAICGATLEIARAGLTNNTRHTSNAMDYLKSNVTNYQDEQHYVDAMAITDKNLITASGLGAVDFGREIIRQLKIYNETDTQRWFELFKNGIYSKIEITAKHDVDQVQ